MKLTAEFLLTATASDIRDSLERGSITSVELVNTYLDHIDRHNKTGAKCNAVLFPALRFQALAWAAKLDRERANGATRGPLHGIPILIKDSIATGIELGMPTTAGSHALLNSRPPQNSDVVERLLESGLIILGKANMTEFLGKKGLAGWSAVGGMCQPAYIAGGYRIGEKRRGETTPAGSSTGSAVGVACGFSPISLGTETTGSIVSPAAVAALYALKLTPGSVSLKGVLHLTRCFDTIGAMGKSAFDVALTCDVLLPANDQSSLSKAAGSVDLKSLSVGFVDLELWRLPKATQVPDPEYLAQTAEAYNNAKKSLSDHGVTVKDVYITPPEQYIIDGVNVDDLMDVIINRQSKRGFDDYLKNLQYTDVHTLEEVIKFNERHPDLEFHKDYCPNQNTLHRLVEITCPDAAVAPLLDECRKWAATEGVDRAVQTQGVDVVVCISDSFFAGVSVAARYPMASVPLSYIESSGRPYGLQAIAPANQEARLVEFMAAWESIMPPRRLPDLEACARAREHL